MPRDRDDLIAANYLPGLEPRRDCLHCGQSFAFEIGVSGRPPEFCSAECRRLHRADQIRAWQSQHAGEVIQRFGLECRQCGSTFDAPRLRGRVPDFCSRRCRDKWLKSKGTGP